LQFKVGQKVKIHFEDYEYIGRIYSIPKLNNILYGVTVESKGYITLTYYDKSRLSLYPMECPEYVKCLLAQKLK